MGVGSSQSITGHGVKASAPRRLLAGDHSQVLATWASLEGSSYISSWFPFRAQARKSERDGRHSLLKAHLRSDIPITFLF